MPRLTSEGLLILKTKTTVNYQTQLLILAYRYKIVPISSVASSLKLKTSYDDESVGKERSFWRLRTSKAYHHGSSEGTE